MFKISYDEMKNVIENSISMRESARKLKMSYRTFKRYAEKFGLYKPNQGRRGYTKKDGRKPNKKIIAYSKVLVENSTYKRENLKRRLIEDGILEYKCSICGINEWNNKKIVLEIDHINGINNDNRIENLRLLCPNCHSQTEHFRGRNKKKPNTIVTDQLLLNIIEDCESIHEVLKKSGLSMGEPNYNKVKLLMKKYNKNLKTKEIKRYFCIKCNIELKSKNKNMMCIDCYRKSLYKQERPSYEILIKDIKELGYCATGRKYNVSDNAIRKWKKAYEKERV
jgi:5-methylcytosine-specific restriction endonuclease McrA